MVIKQLYFAFPNDAGLDYDALWRTLPGYLATAVYVEWAARGCRMQVGAETRERTLRLGGYAFLLDQFIDDQPLDQPWRHIQAREMYVRLIEGEALDETNVPAWVDRDLLVVARLFNSATEERELTVLRELALKILDYSNTKARERRVWRYASMVRNEGRAYAQMATECLASGERLAGRYKLLKRWCGHFVAGGILLDSARDLAKDYHAGRTRVKPTLVNCAVLAGHCLIDALMLGLYPRVSVVFFKEFVKFWGKPFRLRSSWGRPAAEWRNRVYAACAQD